RTVITNSGAFIPAINYREFPLYVLKPVLFRSFKIAYVVIDNQLSKTRRCNMKVLALNSSPRGGGHSKTELMLNSLVGGMRDAGAEVEVVALREKTIKNCVGCYTCWTRPDSIESFLLLLPLGLNAKAVGERKVVLQFSFFGEVEASCYFTIETGKVDAQSGTSACPDLTIETSFGVWMDILTGKADGRQMLKDQKYKVSGDLSFMLQLSQKA
ncbi:MAG: SCP2 sterol-binding domain-containing protein, partial [Dissulfurispiraceae bacterium]